MLSSMTKIIDPPGSVQDPSFPLPLFVLVIVSKKSFTLVFNLLLGEFN